MGLAPRDMASRSSPEQPLLALWPQTGHLLSLHRSVLLRVCRWRRLPGPAGPQVWGEDRVKQQGRRPLLDVENGEALQQLLLYGKS